MNDHISLNVGGQLFQSTQTTLLSKGENFFSSLLSDRIPSTIVPIGGCDAYFIDRDPAYFAPLLEYLRTGALVVPTGMLLSALLREANFYVIDLPPEVVELAKQQVDAGHRDIAKPLLSESLQSDGFYVFEGDDIGCGVCPYVLFLQLMTDGNTHRIASRHRKGHTFNDPTSMVNSPTVKYTFYAHDGMVNIDDHEYDEHGKKLQFSCMHGVLLDSSIVLASTQHLRSGGYRLTFRPSAPPIPSTVYCLQPRLDKMQPSAIKMMRFAFEDDRRGTVSYFELVPTVGLMTPRSAPFIAVWQTPDTPAENPTIGSRNHMDGVSLKDCESASDDEGEGAESNSFACGKNRLLVLKIDADRFCNSRLYSLGDVLVETLLGSHFIYTATNP